LKGCLSKPRWSARSGQRLRLSAFQPGVQVLVGE
jgi:hypothetical protein